MQEIEVLKILAEIAIFFMSITVPTYAIAISFLGKEYSRILGKIKDAREKLERQLNEGGDIVYEELERKIDEFRAKEQEFKKELRPLSVLYVILIPSSIFAVALLILVVGILSHPQGFIVGELEIAYGLLGTFFIIIGVVILMYVLLKIERIAKRPEIVEKESGE